MLHNNLFLLQQWKYNNTLNFHSSELSNIFIPIFSDIPWIIYWQNIETLRVQTVNSEYRIFCLFCHHTGQQLTRIIFLLTCANRSILKNLKIRSNLQNLVSPIQQCPVCVICKLERLQKSTHRHITDWIDSNKTRYPTTDCKSD